MASWRSSGTIVANGDAGIDMSSAKPSGLAINDIMIFAGLDADNERFDLAMPIGWSIIRSDNSNNNLGFTLAWKRYDGTETDWWFDTPTGNGQLVCGVIHAFQGCIKVGNPINVSSLKTVVQNSNIVSLSLTVDVDTLKVVAFFIEDNVGATRTSDGDWTERDNQTTTVGSDGRLILETTTTVDGTNSRYTLASSEYWGNVTFGLIPETHRPTIVPNTADAHDFGADDTPTLEFTGSDANNDDLEYQLQILSALDVNVDTYNESNADTNIIMNAFTFGVGMSFTGNGEVLEKATFYLNRSGTLAGQLMRVALYAHSGTFGTNSLPTGAPLAISNTVLASTVPVTPTNGLIDFVFPIPFTLVNTTKYVIVIHYQDGNATFNIRVRFDNTSGTHGGNRSNQNNLGVWNAFSQDIIFYIKTHTVELDKFSVTPDATFTNTTDGGDTHPFDQPDKIDYTVGYSIFESYNETNENEIVAVNSTRVGVAQSFTGTGDILDAVGFRLSKNGSPTGNMVAKIYAHSGTFGTSSIPTGAALAVSDTIDITTLTTISRLIQFNFSTPFTPISSTKYVITIEYVGTSSDYLLVGRDNTPTHEGNYSSLISGTWTENNARDLVFYLFKTESLADGTWFWRARAIDPTGTNEWSDWTTIRSFEIGSSGDTLIVQDSSHSHSVDNIGLTVGLITLSVADVLHSHTVDSVVVTQTFTLVTQESLHSHTVNNVVITAKYSLTANDSSHSHNVDGVLITAKYDLITVDTLHSQTTDNIDINVSYIVTINDANHSHLVDAVIVITDYSLITESTIHAHIVDNIVLSGTILLVIAESSHSHTSDNTVLTSHYDLESQDSNHSHLVDSLVIEPKYNSIANDSLHNHISDNIVTTSKYSLVVSDSSHSHSTDSIDLIEANILTVQESLHSHSVDNLDLLRTYDLDVTDSNHAHSTENVIITSKYILAINETVHTQTVDNIVIVPEYNLITNDSTHSHVADNLDLLRAYNLEVQESNHNHIVDSVIVTANLITLVSNDTLHSHSVDNLDIVQKSTLEVQDSSHSHFADSLVIEVAGGSSELIVTFPFDTDGDGFVFTSGSKATGTWQATGGNPTGVWDIHSIGRNNLDTSYIELTTTWEALGVPIGSPVNNINESSFDWRCDFVNVSDGYTVGPLEIWDNVIPTLQAILISGLDGSGLTSYASRVGGSVAVPSGIQASDTVIKIRFSITLDNGNNGSAETSILIDNLSLTLNYAGGGFGLTLTVQDSVHAHSSENTVLVPDVSWNLLMDDSLHSHSSENAVLVPKYNLVVADALHAHTSDNTVLDYTEPSILLIVEDTSHSHIVDAVILTSKYSLAVNDTTQGHLADAVVLTSKYSLAVQDSLHSHSTENVVLITSLNLIVEDSNHSHLVDSVLVIPKYAIVVFNSIHGHSVDSPLLTSKYGLVNQDTIHNHLADNIVLLFGTGVLPNDSVHNHTADGIVLTSLGLITLTVNDSLHSHSADNIVLTNKYSLLVNDAVHNHTADNVVVVFGLSLIVADSVHSHSVDNIVLGLSLIVADSVHLHNAEAVVLSRKYILTVNDSVHSLISGNVFLEIEGIIQYEEIRFNSLIDNELRFNSFVSIDEVIRFDSKITEKIEFNSIIL